MSYMVVEELSGCGTSELQTALHTPLTPMNLALCEPTQAHHLAAGVLFLMATVLLPPCHL